MKCTRRICGALVGLAALLAANVACAEEADGPRRRRQGPPEGAGRGGEPQGRGRRQPPPIIKALDADRNGEISAEEIANAAAALKTLDKNGDGKLTRDEIMPEWARRGGPEGGGEGDGPPRGGPGGGEGGRRGGKPGGEGDEATQPPPPRKDS